MHERDIPEDAERWVFGGCYPMALAIHDRTGWKMRGLAAIRSVQRGEQIAHIWIVRPDGVSFDAGGLLDEKDCVDYLLAGEKESTKASARLVEFDDRASFFNYIQDVEGAYFDSCSAWLDDTVPKADQALSEFQNGHLADLVSEPDGMSP